VVTELARPALSGTERVRRLATPASIAVVGPSRDPRRLAGRPLDFLQRYDFPGELYAVRPDGLQIGRAKGVPEIGMLPDGVDLAILVLPALKVLPAIRACAARGIANAVIIASGFAENGRVALQRRLTDFAAAHGISLLGPNCLGFVSARQRVHATAASFVVEAPCPVGGIGLVAQSGALGTAIARSLMARGAGMSYWFSTGNEISVDALDTIEFMLADEHTSVIGCFAEGLKDGSRLAALAPKIRAAGKPVVIMKSGFSPAGQEAIASHTGKISSGAEVWRDIAAQRGITLVSSPAELLNVLAVSPSVPWRTAGRTVITSASGGLAGLLADHCTRECVPIAKLSARSRATIKSALPSARHIGNPVDVGAMNDDGLAQCIQAFLADRSADLIIPIVGKVASGDYASLTRSLAALRRRHGPDSLPVILSFLGSGDVMSAQQRSNLGDTAAVVDDPAEGIRAIGALLRSRRWPASAPDRLSRIAIPVRRAAHAAAPAGAASLYGAAAAHGVPAVPTVLVRDEERAVQVAQELTLPVAMKGSSRGLMHRTERGLVRVNVQTVSEVRACFRELVNDLAADGDAAEGVLIQPQVAGAAEVLLNVRWDGELGPVLTIAAGGTLVDLMTDVGFLQLPAGRRDIEHRISGLRIGALLRGYRGSSPCDLAGIVDAASGLIRMFAASPGIAELECNPLIVGLAGQGCYAVDIKAVPVPAGAQNGGLQR
jgi:acetate---CoA ligase (ADP-forming)